MKKLILTTIIILNFNFADCQQLIKSISRLPDTGQNNSYTNTFGEDNDVTIFPPFFEIFLDGTVKDTITGLMWQKTDGGEMTIENAAIYCDTLTLGGYSNWRLPTALEAFTILNHQHANPALDPAIFTASAAEYWWTSNRQMNDSSKVWATNAGGGIGNHPKSETISAGGIKKFHVRAVRDINLPQLIENRFIDNSDGTITDNLTHLIWQKNIFSDTLSWEEALNYSNTLTLAGKNDWRLPNIKELRSLNDESLVNPSLNSNYFIGNSIQKFWSSTTLPNQTSKAWFYDTHFGITTYYLKTHKIQLICVRGGNDVLSSTIKKTTADVGIKVFPNPANNFIEIVNSNHSKEINTKITNTIGEVIVTSNSNKIDTSLLLNGLYCVEIAGDYGTYKTKLLVIH